MNALPHSFILQQCCCLPIYTSSKELLQENFESKISTCPDFAGMSHEEAMQDLKERVHKYEARYETIDVNTQASYIKIFNLSSRLMVNHVYGRLAKVVIPALMSFNTGSQPIFLCRAGETKAMRKYIQQKQASLTNSPTVPGRTISDVSLLLENNGQHLAASSTMFQKRLRGDRLGEAGLRFRDKLCDFIEKECVEYIANKFNMPYHNHHPSKNDTGTSISGLRHQSEWPCLVMSSTMPRALETASWDRLQCPVKDVCNLNPLDMGDFAGMDLETIKVKHPEWYRHLEREPFHTRFVVELLTW
jgi:6-phosphofructo-2-kinase/Histidine phosphatase superfamily (branch 1)